MALAHRILLLGFTIGVTTLAAPRSKLHCAQPPKVTLKTPNDTTSIETVCLYGFDNCDTSTFYRSELLSVIVKEFKTKKHCAIGRVDSVYRFLILDSSYNFDSTLYVDTLQGEKVWTSILSHLKTPIPESKLVFNETLFYWPPNQSQVSYRPMINTSFVAFFNTYKKMTEMGIGPVDGCFYEPYVFSLKEGKILAQGEIRRKPGIFLPLDLFLSEVADSSIPGFIKIDSSTMKLPFRFGKSKFRRISPVSGTMPKF